MTSIAADPVKVYIAEDNPILLQGLERALTANGYDVKTAVDGGQLLEMLGAAPLPDILLVDVMMPVVNGLDVLEAVRSNPRTSGVPVMLITAAADELLPKAAADGHGAEVLMKPFRLNDLLSRIEEKVNGHRSKPPAVGASERVTTPPAAD